MQNSATASIAFSPSSQMQSGVNLVAKLLAVKGHFRPLVKDAQNTYTNSSYASLNSIIDAVEGALCSFGLLTYTCIEYDRDLGRPIARTYLVNVEMEESLSSSFPISDPNPQKIAAAVTYARRINLMAMLNLKAEDDDGNSFASSGGQASYAPSTAENSSNFTPLF